MLFEIAMLIIGLSVAVLVVFLIQTLKKVQTSLDAATTTMTEVQQVVQTVKGDVGEIVNSAKRIADQAEGKLTAIDPLVETVRETGEVLHEVASVAHDFSSIWTDRLKRRAEAAAAKQQAKAAQEQSAAARMDSYAADDVPEINMGAGHDGLNGPHHITVEAEPAVKASFSPSWLDWMETGVRVARVIAKQR
ncbi:DUF948 domain-containing protein [Paenibacillus mendelii]|uniref:DUF948 domain-containing protein n=1 Tax=Paenibacillus mendelii TaxID=206163 RepID=A0ABV6JC18_9BACL|nr:DUF948 domain-containing protein [Paenibacillus mendelii]MCQ6562705.1 DUF948 domain-containing protein [Paenibacillus mendelii]